MLSLGGSGYLVVILVLYLFSSLKIVNEYERGVKFTLGKYVGVMNPGLKLIFPFIQFWRRVDMRVKAVDVPDQDCMTKDNVSVNVNAVLYYKVSNAEKAILEVESYNYAVSQLSQTTMRDVVGEVTLDKLLGERAPEECDTVLDATAPGAGFGWDSAGSANVAQCGG